jgi:hypothetical protein
MIARNLSRALAVVPILVSVAALRPAAAAEGPSGACFDVVAGQVPGEAAGAILLNRCNGRTWILTQIRSASADEQPTYRWSPIAGGDNPPVAASPPAPPKRHAAAPVEQRSGKCFTFQGRQYCE